VHRSHRFSTTTIYWQRCNKERRPFFSWVSPFSSSRYCSMVGQLAVDRATGGGFVTAYGCDDGIPRDSQSNINKADLNDNGAVTPVTSNRLIVKADNGGDFCFHASSRAEVIIDEIDDHLCGRLNSAAKKLAPCARCRSPDATRVAPGSSLCSRLRDRGPAARPAQQARHRRRRRATTSESTRRRSRVTSRYATRLRDWFRVRQRAVGTA
jgi:hypothetical protein